MTSSPAVVREAREIGRLLPQMLPASGPADLAAFGEAAQVFENVWLPFLDTYRTMCLVPEPAFRQILEDIRDLHVVV
jgi:hypothetical protein